MNRKLYLPVFLALCAAAGAAQAAPRDELVREILRRIPDWPNARVEVPMDVYEQYLRELMAGPVPPQPPEVVWIERSVYTVRPGETEAALEAALEVVSLPGEGTRSLPALPVGIAWGRVTVDGQAVNLRSGPDGWLIYDAPGPGRFRIVGEASVKVASGADPRRLALPTPPSAWAAAAVESDQAWDVRFSRCPLAVIGGAQGTRGTVGLVPGDQLQVTWRRPQPDVHRQAQIAVESHVGWTLADGVHQVRAILDLRLWGGEASELVLTLPPGADRAAITGPDVREVQVQGTEARVFLRGAVVQRTRLNVSFESPRPATGRMTLPAINVQGASHRGGTLAIAGGAGGVLLEMDSPGLAAMALADLPAETRGLLTSTPVYAYALKGPWEARADLVGMSEFPVRETLVDSALYTVLYRPDGRVMVKVIYEVRNRGQQFMAADMPEGAELVVARVAERQRNLARGPGRTVYVPLEKSVLTTAGLVSFPVELVYVMAAEPLARRGTFRLPLPRVDLPVAYARCALMLPEGMTAGEWQGALRRVPSWSSETVELEFEYGTGHLAPGLRERPPESGPETPTPSPLEKPKTPGLLDALGSLFAPKEEAKYNALTLKSSETDRLRLEAEEGVAVQDERAQAAGRVLQAKNLYRAGTDYYQRKDYQKAGELFRQIVEVAPKSSEAENARKFLSNVEIALGQQAADAQTDRGLKAASKAVRLTQQGGNVEERQRQQELLFRAQEALRRGDEAQAEAAYKVAVGLGRKLQTRGEAAQEQKAVVREAEKFLGEREAERRGKGEKVEELRQELVSLKAQITETGGREMAQVVEALTLGDVPVQGQMFDGVAAGPGAAPATHAAQPARQIEADDVLAEQTVAMGDKAAAGRAGYGFAPTGEGQIEALKKQVEQLKAIQGTLTAPAGGTRGRGGGGYGGPSPDVSGFDVSDLTPAVTRAPALEPAYRDESAVVPRTPDLGAQVAEKAKGIAAQAKEAAALAREGRLAEAQRLVETLERKAEVTEEAARVIGRSSLAGVVPAQPPSAGAESRDAQLAQLWGRAAELRQQMDFDAAGGVLDRIVALAPDDEKARRWHEDLGYLQAQRREVEARLPALEAPVAPRPGAADTARPEVRGGTTYLRYPDAKDWKDLTEFRKGFSKDVAGKELADVEANLSEARRELQRQSKELEKVQFSVADLTGDAVNVRGADGQKLAEFVASNYGWAMTGNVQVRDGAAVTTFFADMNGDGAIDVGSGQVSLHVSGGNLVVANQPVAVERVQEVLERLRLNLGQRVAVASRNVVVAPGDAATAGVLWQEGANGVRYAVANEGQLLALMDLEQRRGASVSGRLPARQAYQEAVVGTQAVIANGAVATVALAGDDANTLDYAGNAVQVSHDDYLLVDNGRYVTAVKSGRMRHWSAEVEPVRFPGVPAAVIVPAVGTTVKFEKTLLDTSDTLELVAEYTWEGAER